MLYHYTNYYFYSMSKNAVVLFDGVCNLCSSSVQFIINHDPKGYFKFASLQSEAGQALLQDHQLDTASLKSLVLLEQGKAYTHSTGALRIAKRLSGAWPLLYGFIIIPPFLRNAVYNLIARNRYRWFGKKEACWLPTPALRSRFL